MGRKKKSSEDLEGTSTVINIRNDHDWGKILFNACYMFNHNLALHWLDYVDNYDNGKSIKTTSQHEADILLQKRNDILKEKQRLKDNIKNNSQNAITSYRQYAKSLPVGKMVGRWRNNTSIEEYNDIIQKRKEHYNNYNKFHEMLKNANVEEDNYRKAHLFEIRNFSSRAKTLQKLVDIHSLELSHPIQDDKQIMYDFLTSDEQAERLMGVCLNILNTYSQKEFSTMMTIKDRECIADSIYELFFNFNHNYDFIAGCYELHEDDNKLHLKDLELLKNKFYNGYYFTIRGFVQRSYASIRKEHFNITSADNNWEDDEGNGNHGIDNFANSENKKNGGYSTINASAERYKFDEGMISFWKMCCDYLNNHINEMANELYEKVKIKFAHMPYYSKMTDDYMMQQIIINIINSINNELSCGRNVGRKFKHLVLDSMGGAETKEEWKVCSNFIMEILIKYINNFFIVNNINLYGEQYENV